MAAQVLPTPPSQYHPNHMAYGSDMLNPFSNFDSFSTGNAAYTSGPPHQSLLMVSPPSVNSEVPYRRRSSLSPQAALSAPVLRDRTPIRHHRPSLSRGRSHSRGDMLLAFANEQNQLHQTQSLPSITAMPSQGGSTMPQMYNMPGYNISPPITSFPHQGGYFGTPVPSQSTQQDNSGEFSLSHNDTEPHGFYPVGRTPSHGSAMSLPPPDSPNALYMHGQQQHGQQPLPSIGMTMQPFPPVPLTLESSPAEIEIMPSRPKPQCWDHGCNGRQFSTFSNLLRHQREKSGSAVKAICPHCGTEFTRTTARNGHMSGGKCKGRPEGDGLNKTKNES
ncbi:hypothetical protein, variant 3 [Phialophora macrospora]|nr:hypothetical protein, variant 1 [Phialophora macrospora]KIW73538.1 hypothetical protein, variant 2 [Phialophora macrospora]KIW73539.1 hypothetical protein, variant 3 [Phialophora macrospora]